MKVAKSSSKLIPFYFDLRPEYNLVFAESEEHARELVGTHDGTLRAADPVLGEFTECLQVNGIYTTVRVFGSRDSSSLRQYCELFTKEEILRLYNEGRINISGRGKHYEPLLRYELGLDPVV